MLFSKKLQTICNKLSEECEKSDMDFRHASGLMCGGKLLSTGFNTNNRSLISGAIVPSVHSEVMAIHNYLKLRREKQHCILFVSR